MYRLKLPNLIKQGWENSPLRNLPSQGSQFKGKLGTEILRQHLNAQGIQTRFVSNEGDIVVTMTDSVNGKVEKKAEVKTALVDLEFLKSGKVNERLWWNQIRPLQSGWKLLYLVGVYPDAIRIWEFDRNNAIQLAEKTGGCEHTGQGDEKGLLAVEVKKNTKGSNFGLLDTYGKMIAEIAVDQIQITNA